jgi:hypothetical protein
VAGSGQHNTARLTRAIARGDRDALATFYNAWFDRSYAAARRLTGRDESFCLDVVRGSAGRQTGSRRFGASRPQRWRPNRQGGQWRVWHNYPKRTKHCLPSG